MVFQHALAYSLFTVLPALASVITLSLFTRLMSPVEFAEYSLTIYVSTVLVSIFTNFLIIGLGRFEPAFTSAQERKSLHSTILVVVLFINILLAVILVTLYVNNILPDLSINYFQLAIIFQVSVLLLLTQKLANAKLLPKAYGYSQFLKNYLFLALGCMCLLFGFDVNAVLVCFSIASLFALLPALNLWDKTSFRTFDKKILRTLWSYGAPLTLLYLFVMVIGLSDRIFIDVMLGGHEVGLYSAGYDFSQYSIGVLGTIVHLALFPMIIKSYEDRQIENTQILLLITVKLLFLIILPVSLGFIVTRYEISNLFLGNDFSAAASHLIPIFSLTVLAHTIKSYYFDYSFQIAKATWFQLIPPFVAAAVNCILNYFLILSFGLVGAAYATLIASLVYLVLTVFLANRIFALPRFPYLFSVKVSFSAVLMAIIIELFPDLNSLIFSLILKVVLGSLIYFGLLYLSLRMEILKLIQDARRLRSGS